MSKQRGVPQDHQTSRVGEDGDSDRFSSIQKAVTKRERAKAGKEIKSIALGVRKENYV